MAEPTDTIFREVDEELRREQLAKLWQAYGTYMIGAAFAIVVGVGGYQYYLHRNARAIEATGARYDAAAQLITAGKTDDARGALEDIAKDGPDGYATLARLRLAAAAAKAGKIDDAVVQYEALAKDGGADQVLRDFARLQTASLKLDTADWTEMQNRLIELCDNANAWRYSARELMGLAALKAGRLDEARKYMELLLGERNVPPSIVERAKVAMASIVAAELAAAAPPVPAKAVEPAKAEPKAPEAVKPAEDKKKK